MAISQNGWTVITSGTNENLVAIPKIAGRVRKGDVAMVFTDLVEFFDKNIEDVDKGEDEWGYAFRSIRGQSSGYSNHASGTALDLNATQHPLGARNTFTDAQEKKIRAMLKERYLGKIRWGGDYQNRADEMHFEVIGSAADMKKVVAHLKKINGKRIYTKPTAHPTYLSKLRFGQRDSESVKNLQRKLNAHKMPGGNNLPITGNYLDQTDAEVRLCQKLHGYGSDAKGRSFVGPRQAKHLGLTAK